MNDELHHRLMRFLVNLELLDTVGRHDAIMNETIETGGWFGTPQSLPRAPSGTVEITLHGITAYGECASNACASWVAAARFAQRPNMGVSGCVS